MRTIQRDNNEIRQISKLVHESRKQQLIYTLDYGNCSAQ